MPMMQSRRRFLTTLSLVGAASLVRTPRAFAAEGTLETKSVRLVKVPSICHAPQYVADDLLRAEGFTDIRFVERGSSEEINDAIAQNEADFATHFCSELLPTIDNGGAITILSGVHVGCLEFFAHEDVRKITDLKGKRVAVPHLRSTPDVFISAMAARVGLNPAEDIRWIVSKSPKPIELFADGKVDAFLGTPPEPQELRARHLGHVIVNTAVDRPWSQYYCCMLAGNRDYVRNYPVATKRVLRAILKATDFCAVEPARAARQLVAGGFTSRYDYAVEALREIPYDRWREYDAEDTVRFYALLLREAGIIKSTPQKLIAENTDWRFLDELKRELKT
jgi:NitT/TauT family transport system substrate-binding protein